MTSHEFRIKWDKRLVDSKNIVEVIADLLSVIEDVEKRIR